MLDGWRRMAADGIRRLEGVAIVEDAPDVVVGLGGVQVSSEPPLGIWMYGFGDGAPFAAGASGTIARLYRLTGDSDRAIVLHEGWYPGPSDDWIGTTSVGERVAPWCARLLQRILAGDRGVIDGVPVSTAGCAEPDPPVGLRSARTAIGQAVARWRRRERWTIGVLPFGVADLLARSAVPEPRWLREQPADRFFADPFPIRREGEALRLLAEEYPYASKRGSIVELLLNADGSMEQRRLVRTGEDHLAYPFVLRVDGRTFYLPESATTSAIDLATGASYMVFDVFRAADATLTFHAGRWWLFCANRDVENRTDVHLFFANAWMGPWTPHPLNPVKSDARSSRPAGACFELDGALYRPAQDCSRRYGGGVAINRVLELSPTRFQEETVHHLRPDPSWAWPDGLHTLNSLEGLTLVDGLRVER
jgi:hypothetical protein